MGCFCFGGRKKKENKDRRNASASTGKPRVSQSSNTGGYSGKNQAYRNIKAGGGATRDGDMVIMIGAGAATSVGDGGGSGGDGGCASSGGHGGHGGHGGGGGCGGGGGGGGGGGCGGGGGGGGGCGGGGGGC